MPTLQKRIAPDDLPTSRSNIANRLLGSLVLVGVPFVILSAIALCAWLLAGTNRSAAVQQALSVLTSLTMMLGIIWRALMIWLSLNAFWRELRKK
jgi:ABC-type dipeptide/oligopeptide/nickel transport system permease component